MIKRVKIYNNQKELSTFSILNSQFSILLNVFSLLFILHSPLSIIYAQSVTLPDILNQIENNHPELKMYEAKSKAFANYASGARSWEPPQLSGGLWMAPYQTALWKADPNNMAIPMGMGAFMISGTQMFPNFKMQKANEKYMGSMAAVERSGQNYARNNLFFEAKMNYYEWVILKKKIALLRENESLLNFIIKTGESRYTYNKEKLSNIYKAKAVLISLSNEITDMENEIQQKKVSLNTLLNRDKAYEFDIDTSYIVKDPEASSEQINTIAVKRSDIQILDQNIKLNDLKRKVERSKRGLTYGVRYDHMQSFGEQPNLFTIMAMVNIPIVPWAAREYKANETGLKYETEAMEKQREALLNNVTGALNSLIKQINYKKKQLKLYETGILPALQRTYKTTLLAYEQNTEDLFMVLDARQNYQMAQMEYLNQLQDLLLLQATYEKEAEIY